MKGGTVGAVALTVLVWGAILPAQAQNYPTRPVRVILPFAKDLLTVVWNRWLKEQGMHPEDVEQVYAGATPNRFAALAGGSVQGALLTQPFDFRAAADGYRKLLDIGAYGKEYGFLTILARSQWLKELRRGWPGWR